MGKIKPKLRKDLNVKLSMSRSSTGKWGLRITDEASGLMIGDIEMTNEQFADLMANMYVDGKMEYYGSPNIGMIAEHKSIMLKFDKNPGYGEGEFEKEIEKAASKYEKQNPGWTVERYKNSRQFNGTNLEYATHAIRYVEAK